MNISKLVLVLASYLIASLPLYAELKEEKTLHFELATENLVNGDIFFYTTVLPPRQMGVKYPELYEMDSLLLFQEPDVQMILSKAIFVVNKPVGFFEDKQMTEERFVRHLMGEQKVKKVSNATYKIHVEGEYPHSFRKQIFFDADDVSTLPNSKIIRAVGAAKRLDIISKGASTIMFSESTNFSDHLLGAVSVSSFIPLKEEKTLIIEYHLKALKKDVLSVSKIKAGLKEEIQARRDLMENFK